VERKQSIMAQNIFWMVDEAKLLFDYFPHPLGGKKCRRCVDLMLDEAGLSMLEHQEQAITTQSHVFDTDLELENSSDVRLEEQTEVLLFGSAKAASEIAWMLRGNYDGSNGVISSEPDSAALATATKLLETEFCQVGDYCSCSNRDFYLNQDPENKQAQELEFTEFSDTLDELIIAELDYPLAENYLTDLFG